MPKLERITFNSSVMGGKPCIRGMRVTVGTVIGLLHAGYSKTEIFELYPYLEPEDIEEAQVYTGASTQPENDEFLLEAAVKLFDVGELSSGAAANLAGIPRTLFLERLVEFEVDTFSQTETELVRELNNS